MPYPVIGQFSRKASTPRGRALSGSVVLLAGLGLVTLINFAYNIAVARFLGPIAFGHTTAVYTLLILISAITLSFQILTAKIVAQQWTPEAQNVVYRRFHQWGWAAGIFAGLLLLFFREGVTNYLNLPGPILIVLLAVGVTFYVPLGARRGFVQGACKFRLLALNLVLEGLGRLCGSLLLIKLGLGVPGVIAANSAAIVIAYVFIRPRLGKLGNLTIDIPLAFRESLQVAVFFSGQVIINNCDIVVVKHFFAPELAGVYAAAAMVGRVVFAFAWAIVSSMFPIAAETSSRKQQDSGLLGSSLLMVLGTCLIFILGLRLAPGAIWEHLFGSQFGAVAGEHFRYLLVLYAASTSIYGLSVVLIAYEMSRKIANTGWVQLVFSGLVVAGIYRFHGSLAQVIVVQIVVMSALLACVAVPFLSVLAKRMKRRVQFASYQPIRIRRRMSEDEVIAEFLKSDFHSPEYEPYQEALQGVVLTPNLADDDENRVRRALLNVRHGSLWRELPSDTRWFETEVRFRDLQQVRVFPRAQWRKLALGDFAIVHVAHQVLENRDHELADGAFREKIEDLRLHLQSGVIADAVLLIGLTEKGPFTILDGNHRLVAATLTSPEAMRRFRFYCGLSPRMAQCCWYQTSPWTLLRYGTNIVRHLVRDPEQELMALLQQSKRLDART